MAGCLIPEPPNGAYVLVGELAEQEVYVRDDKAAAEDYGVGQWWFKLGDNFDHPITWEWLTTVSFTRDLPPEAQALELVERLYTQREVDEVVRAAQLTPVGEHLIEPGGYCRTCGSRHSPEEIARAEDRAEADDV